MNTEERKAEKARQARVAAVDSAINRAQTRVRVVDGVEHLPPVAVDAHLLALEVVRLRSVASQLTRQYNDLLRAGLRPLGRF